MRGHMLCVNSNGYEEVIYGQLENRHELPSGQRNVILHKNVQDNKDSVKIITRVILKIKGRCDTNSRWEQFLVFTEGLSSRNQVISSTCNVKGLCGMEKR